MSNINPTSSGMSRQQYLFAKVAEKCNEIAQRAIKAQLFGAGELQAGHLQDNAERVVGEMLDLLGVWDMLADELLVPRIGELIGDSLTASVIQRKKLKVEKYLEYSRTLGLVV